MTAFDKAWRVIKSEAYDGESESSCAVCGAQGQSVKPTGTGMMACTRPDVNDYLPMDGEGYAGAMLQYQQCQRQARNQ